MHNLDAGWHLCGPQDKQPHTIKKWRITMKALLLLWQDLKKEFGFCLHDTCNRTHWKTSLHPFVKSMVATKQPVLSIHSSLKTYLDWKAFLTISAAILRSDNKCVPHQHRGGYGICVTKQHTYCLPEHTAWLIVTMRRLLHNNPMTWYMRMSYIVSLEPLQRTF